MPPVDAPFRRFLCNVPLSNGRDLRLPNQTDTPIFLFALVHIALREKRRGFFRSGHVEFSSFFKSFQREFPDYGGGIFMARESGKYDSLFGEEKGSPIFFVWKNVSTN